MLREVCGRAGNQPPRTAMLISTATRTRRRTRISRLSLTCKGRTPKTRRVSTCLQVSQRCCYAAVSGSSQLGGQRLLDDRKGPVVTVLRSRRIPEGFMQGVGRTHAACLGESSTTTLCRAVSETSLHAAADVARALMPRQHRSATWLGSSPVFKRVFLLGSEATGHLATSPSTSLSRTHHQLTPYLRALLPGGDPARVALAGACKRRRYELTRREPGVAKYRCC
jgi:hypothetical protein